MIKFSLRFYGRFVLAQEQNKGNATGNVTFLLPRMEAKGIKPHTPLMSAARADVSWDADETTLPPTAKILANANPSVAEHFIWDLSGCAVGVPGSGGFRLYQPAMLQDLAELETMQKRTATLDQGNLVPGKLVNATVSFAGGDAVATSMFGTTSYFITEQSARGDNPESVEPVIANRVLADWLEVDVWVRPDRDDAGIVIAKLPISIKVPGEKDIKVVTFTSGTSGALLSFTNLCSEVPTADPLDFEFGQYYALLEATADDRLIPVDGPHLGGEGDCNIPASISYEV